MKYEIGGLSLYVEKRGNGEPAIVFLPHFGGTAKTWEGVVKLLDGQFTTVTYDLHGWGDSDKPKSGYSVEDYAQEAVGLIQKLGLADFVLVGHSLGGKIAQLVASKTPEGLKGLILIAPAPPIALNFPPPVRESLLHMYDSRESITGGLGMLVAKPLDVADLDVLVAAGRSGSSEAVAGFPMISSDEDITSSLNNIKVPTILITGEKDQFTPVDLHKNVTLPLIPGATLVLLKDAGHLVQYDAPEELSEDISKFAKSL